MSRTMRIKKDLKESVKMPTRAVCKAVTRTLADHS